MKKRSSTFERGLRLRQAAEKSAIHSLQKELCRMSGLSKTELIGSLLIMFMKTPIKGSVEAPCLDTEAIALFNEGRDYFNSLVDALLQRASQAHK